MASLSMLAQSNAVAPPGRRERAERRLGGMPVVASMAPAAWRMELVMCEGLTEYQELK